MSETLPALVDRAAQTLASARSAAEILDARDKAAIAYDMAKRAARVVAARNAYDELIPAIHRAQADALVIEAGAKRRLADEYDAAQERGEVRQNGGDRTRIPEQNSASVTSIGLTHKTIHAARIVRDAEEASPGIVRRTVDEALANGEEPTKAKVRRAVEAVAPSRGKAARKEESARQAEYNSQREMRARIWRDLRAGLEALAALPSAQDVAAIAAGTHRAAPIVDRRLPQALTFLKEFSDAWNA